MSSNADLVRVNQLGYVGFGVSDLEAWRKFAGDLGLQDNGTSANGSMYLRMDEYHHRFEIIPSGEDDLVYAGWEVKDADAMQSVAAQIRSAGHDVTEGTAEEAAERMVLGLVKFKDPNGIAMEVYYGPYLDDKPFNAPRAISGFKAMDHGLGHIFLLVDNMEACTKFYMQALGVRITDYIKLRMGPREALATFTHVNPRHHSLAMVQVPAPPPGAPRRRLGHFMIEVKSLDDVGYTRSLLTERGHSCGGFGRHSNDRMFSFYLNTPSGFQVEYGCEGRTIDNEDEWQITQYTVPSFWGHERPEPPKAPAGAPAANAKPEPEHIG